MNVSSSLMSEGSIKIKIIKFALPIFWGNLFQQLYNIVDALVVGNFTGSHALAAISSTAPLIFIIVGFSSGLFSGAGIIISNYFGAKDKDLIQKSIGTYVLFGLISGIILTFISILLSPLIIKIIGTPTEIFKDTRNYLIIYFSGIIFLILYNTASGIFQAIGDSKHPLYYLIISSIINIILDIILVAKFNMGVIGASISTIISQAISVFLAFYRLVKIDDIYRLKKENIRLNISILKQMLKIGLPAGIQNLVVGFANLIVQSSINSFGTIAMAASGAYVKIEGFVFIPINSFSMALTTFISQNIGAKKPERAKIGAKFGMIFSSIIVEIMGLFFYLFAPQLMSLFGSNPNMISIGISRININSLFYFLLSYSNCVAGIIRGAGNSNIPMFILLICWCVIRVIYIVFVTYVFNNILIVFWAYPITWLLSSILFFFFYIKIDWYKHQDNK